MNALTRAISQKEDYYIFEPDDEVFTFYYYPHINQFHDENGFVMIDMFAWLTPTDLYLFRQSKYEHCIFQHRYDREAIVQICTIDLEDESEYMPGGMLRYV